MTQAYRFLSATDGYNIAASRYVISYSRKKEEFPINRIIQMVEAKTPSFFYYKLDRDQAIRVTSLAGQLWADGAVRPSRRDNQFGFRETQAFCNRFEWGGIVGDIALKHADNTWNAKQVYLEGYTCQAMTGRTLNLWQGGPGGGAEGTTTNWGGLDNASTWPSTNVAAANDLNGGAGTWDKAGSDSGNPSNYMAIRKSIMSAMNVIFLQTNSRVRPRDLRLVVSPNLAKAMANSDEMRDAYKYGPKAQEYIEGNDANMNDRFGLPPTYAGVEIVVEDSPILQDLPAANQTVSSTARTFIKNDSNAVIMSRPGKIDAQVGPSFSTVQMHWCEHQLKVEEFHEVKDAYTQFSLVDFYCIVGGALESGFDITGTI